MSPSAFPLPDESITALHARSSADRWEVSRERLAEALARSCAHHFGGVPADSGAVSRYLEGLHVEDLALACACRDGHQGAWDHFAREVQPRVVAAARSMAGDKGEELAGTLLADLYGTALRDGVRRSLLDYFHGRSRLTTWLRTVVAQRHVDALRVERRSSPFEDDRGGESLAASDASGRPGQPIHAGGDVEHEAAVALDRSRVLSAFERELAHAVDALPAGDRLRLAYYYVHRLTLARIATLMGEHESSASRKLERARRQLRDAVERVLRDEHGFGEADLRQCYEEAARHGRLDLEALLAAESGSRVGSAGG